MNRDLSWKVIQTAFKCGREPQELLQLLKANCVAEEYRDYSRGIATAIDTIGVQLIDRALKSLPELHQK